MVDYPLHWPSYKKLSTALLETTNGVYAFVLSPRLEVAQRQRGYRVLSPHEVERIAFHHSTNLHDPGFGVRIDNSEQTLQETAEVILQQLGLLNR